MDKKYNINSKMYNIYDNICLHNLKKLNWVGVKGAKRRCDCLYKQYIIKKYKNNDEKWDITESYFMFILSVRTFISIEKLNVPH